MKFKLGIHRTVSLFTKPKTFIEKVDFNFIQDNQSVFLNYTIDTRPLSKEFVQVSLIGEDDRIVLTTKGSSGKELVENPKLWYPYTMLEHKPYLYTLNVKLLFKTNGTLIDEGNTIYFLNLKTV